MKEAIKQLELNSLTLNSIPKHEVVSILWAASNVKEMGREYPIHFDLIYIKKKCCCTSTKKLEKVKAIFHVPFNYDETPSEFNLIYYERYSDSGRSLSVDLKYYGITWWLLNGY